MFLNQGRFRQNGGCGYILKPQVMRDRDEKGLLFNTVRVFNFKCLKFHG